MRPYEFPNFETAITQCSHQLQYRSSQVHTEMWQGVSISQRPEMRMHELTHVSFAVPLLTEDLDVYREDIRPNLPWADNHFLERVNGQPLNPGVEWANWPYGKSADKFRDKNGQFNHNYMERYWPKWAGKAEGGMLNIQRDDRGIPRSPFQDHQANSGIRYEYGDLMDVVELLVSDPLTRQAYLPVWFPEDTGGGAKRAPCTIGYHFMMRNGQLDVNYHIRSCDFVRHFRDDLYLTVRLTLWIIEQCRKRQGPIAGGWADVKPGKFFIQIGSFHIFANDYHMLFGAKQPEFK